MTPLVRLEDKPKSGAILADLFVSATLKPIRCQDRLGQCQIFGSRDLDIVPTAANDRHRQSKSFNQLCIIGADVSGLTGGLVGLPDDGEPKNLGSLSHPDAFSLKR